MLGDHTFHVFFSKGSDTTGRVGKWRIVLAKRQNIRPLPYSIRQAEADGLTDRELWQAEPIIATGEEQKDAQLSLWPIGQSARAYVKRLDLEFAAALGAPISDDIDKRIYAGVAVTATFLRWPMKGQRVRCALHHERPLQQHEEQTKRMEFHGVLVAQDEKETSLLGTCRFTVSRLNHRGTPIYADGSPER